MEYKDCKIPRNRKFAVRLPSKNDQETMPNEISTIPNKTWTKIVSVDMPTQMGDSMTSALYKEL